MLALAYLNRGCMLLLPGLMILVLGSTCLWMRPVLDIAYIFASCFLYVWAHEDPLCGSRRNRLQNGVLSVR
jgi:hypothetical protein